MSLNIYDLVHQQGVREHEHSLIGKVFFKFGVKRMSLEDLRTSINRVWMIPGLWKFIPMGKGYYNI